MKRGIVIRISAMVFILALSIIVSGAARASTSVESPLPTLSVRPGESKTYTTTVGDKHYTLRVIAGVKGQAGSGNGGMTPK